MHVNVVHNFEHQLIAMADEDAVKEIAEETLESELKFQYFC